jgi:hypothetical protein
MWKGNRDLLFRLRDVRSGPGAVAGLIERLREAIRAFETTHRR